MEINDAILGKRERPDQLSNELDEIHLKAVCIQHDGNMDSTDVKATGNEQGKTLPKEDIIARVHQLRQTMEVPQRAWKELRRDLPGRMIQVTSYNVLAGICATEEFQPHTFAEVLNLNYRGNRVMQEIVNSKSDIVALQEIDRADFYEPALFRAGYSSDVNLRKYTNNCGNIAVAWKRDKIRIIAETPVRFDNLATTYNDKIYLKDYWGQLILFEDIATEKRFVVANCHLFWKPQQAFIKFAQALYLLERTAIFKCEFEEIEELPVIMCGDFNAEPGSPAMYLLHGDNYFDSHPELLRGQDSRHYMAILRHLDYLRKSDPCFPTVYGKLQSVYNDYQSGKTREERNPLWTNFTDKFKGTIDHILVNDKVTVTRILDLPDMSEVIAEGFLPNSKFPSDHVRIAATFVLKQGNQSPEFGAFRKDADSDSSDFDYFGDKSRYSAKPKHAPRQFSIDFRNYQKSLTNDKGPDNTAPTQTALLPTKTVQSIQVSEESDFKNGKSGEQTKKKVLDRVSQLRKTQEMPKRAWKVLLRDELGNKLIVSSYNILAASSANEWQHTHTFGEVLDLQYRGRRVMQEIKSSQSDIVALQELDRPDFYLPAFIEAGYELSKVTRRRIYEDGNIGVAWKPDKFDKVIEEHVDFDDLTSINLKGEEYQHDNWAQIILFKEIASEKLFVVTNCQLCWKPEKAFVRHAQSFRLLTAVANFLKTHGEDLPLIMCGDFNAEPGSPEMYLLHGENYFESHPALLDELNRSILATIKAKKEDSSLDQVIGKLRSVYNQYQPGLIREQRNPPWTTYTKDFKGTIDHILINTKVTITRILKLPDMADIEDEGFLPNSKFPSDHIRIAATISLK